MQFPNPFKSKEPASQSPSYAKPQPGDPGYKPEPVTPGAAKDEGPVQAIKRGLDLLKEDFLKNAPERVGVGRQDAAVVMKPAAGEPGYKPPSYTTVKVSKLGISPFTDDKNFVSKVGGLDAVKQAAVDSVAGKSAKQIKKEALKIADRVESIVEPVDEIKPGASVEAPKDLLPDYLKPIPEDSTRKGMTWKNYAGR